MPITGEFLRRNRNGEHWRNKDIAGETRWIIRKDEETRERTGCSQWPETICIAREQQVILGKWLICA